MDTNTRLWCTLVLLLAAAGCVAAQGGLPRTVRQERARMEADTYRVLNKGLGAGGDGYTFLNDRFRFEFAKEFDGVPGFRTPDERLVRGKAAAEVLNGGYDFVREIFGVEAAQLIGVVISPELDGDPTDARTRISWLESGGIVVDGSQTATMYFGTEAFARSSVLAHELTHALLDVYRLPAWLGEGIATLVEADYADGAHWVRDVANLAPLGLDAEGYNILQTWRGDGSPLLFRSNETYAASYAIVKEIQRRFGKDVFVRLFEDLKRARGFGGQTPVTASEVARRIGRVTGQDARPFFKEIRFRLDELP